MLYNVTISCPRCVHSCDPQIPASGSIANGCQRCLGTADKNSPKAPGQDPLGPCSQGCADKQACSRAVWKMNTASQHKHRGESVETLGWHKPAHQIALSSCVEEAWVVATSFNRKHHPWPSQPTFWSIIPFSKWIMTMVSKPLSRLFPFQMAWATRMSATCHGYISKKCRCPHLGQTSLSSR